MDNYPNHFLKLLSNLLGYMFLPFIIVCLVCLGKFLYSTPQIEAVPQDMPPDKFSKTINQTVGAEHFHILDETVYTDVENAPICLQCHGNFCHIKSEKLRSFYNMHSFFLACETCHIRKKEGEEIVFQWFDDKTGEVVKELKGIHGNYGAKIVPIRKGSQELKRLDKFPKEKLALEYMEFKDTYSEEEKKRIQGELMEHIPKEPITCEECHQKKGYLNYKALGYNKVRSAELSRIEIVNMSQEYEEFYLPTMFDPSVTKKARGES